MVLQLILFALPKRLLKLLRYLRSVVIENYFLVQFCLEGSEQGLIEVALGFKKESVNVCSNSFLALRRCMM